MRTAKAEYIRALKDLRAADAEYTRAKAAVEQANARYRDAETAFKNAQVENQKLLNDLQELWNEATAQENTRRAAEIAAEIEGIQMKMEELAAKHAVKMVEYEAELAQAQEALRTVLRDIAIASKSLSPNEKLAVVEAAALYYGLVQEEIKAEAEVATAQITVDTLVEYKTRFADTAWSRGKLVGVVEKYENDIADYEAIIALDVLAAATVPDTAASLEEWKKALDAAKEVAQEIKVKKAQQTFDSTGYVEAVLNPGIAQFNGEIAKFIVDNWWRDTVDLTVEKYFEPALTTAEINRLKAYPKTTDPECCDETGHTPYDTIGVGKEVKFTDLTGFAKSQYQNYWFNKFAYILVNGTDSSYAQKNVFAKSVPQPQFMTVIDGGENCDTLRIGDKILRGMDEFILGRKIEDGAGSGYKSLSYAEGTKKVTANYGLWGAYEILARVYEQATNATKDSADFFAKEAHKADSTWKAQNKILKAGLAAFEPYQNAIDEFVEAAEIYNDKVDEMNNAINGFVNVWNARYTTGHDWGKDDSTAVVEAIVAFAQARETYLEGWADTVKKYAVNPGTNPNYVYYVAGMDPYKVDSIKISELTLPKIREHSEIAAYAAANVSKYELMPLVIGGAKVARPKTNFDLEGNGDTYGNDHGVFDWIVYNMLGLNAYNVANSSVLVGGSYHRAWGEVTLTKIENVINGNDAYKGLFFGWKYVKGTTLTNGKVVNKTTSGEVGIAAVLAAEKAVRDSVDAFVKVYNEYWGQDADTTNFSTIYADYFDMVINEDSASDIATAKKTAEETFATAKFDSRLMKDGKLKEDSYELSIFNPHSGDKAPLVMFTYPATAAAEGFDIEDSYLFCDPALSALLASEDPFAAEHANPDYFEDDDIYNSAIFYGGAEQRKQTTAYAALYWKYMLWVSDNAQAFGNDLIKIKNWITGVENTFKTANENNKKSTPNPQKYAAQVEKYNKAKDRKDLVDKYNEAKKAFVGTHLEHMADQAGVYKDSAVMNQLLLSDAVLSRNPVYVVAPEAKLKDAAIFAITAAGNLGSYFVTNLIGAIVGWDENVLGGTQLENANKYFGEDYPEMVQEMRVNLKKWENQEADAETFYKLYNEVAMAKAELEGYTAEGTSGAGQKDIRELYTKYKTAYQNLIKAYADDITKYRKKIDDAKHFIAAYKSEVPDFDGLIVKAVETLKQAQAKLNAIQKAKEQAKINLDKIMEYIRSTDAEFVIPVTVEEMNILIKSLAASLDTTFGIDLEDLIDSFAEELGIDLGDED